MFRWHSKVPSGQAAHAHAFCFQGAHVASFLQYSWQTWFLESCFGIRRLLFLFILVDVSSISDSVSWYSWTVVFMYAEFLYKMFRCHLKVPVGQAAHAHAFCFQGAHVASFLQYTWHTWFLESYLRFEGSSGYQFVCNEGDTIVDFLIRFMMWVAIH